MPGRVRKREYKAKWAELIYFKTMRRTLFVSKRTKTEKRTKNGWISLFIQMQRTKTGYIEYDIVSVFFG